MTTFEYSSYNFVLDTFCLFKVMSSYVQKSLSLKPIKSQNFPSPQGTVLSSLDLDRAEVSQCPVSHSTKSDVDQN